MDIERDGQERRDTTKLITQVTDSLNALKNREDVTKTQKIIIVTEASSAANHFANRLKQEDNMSNAALSEILGTDVKDDSYEHVGTKGEVDREIACEYSAFYQEGAGRRHRPGMVKLIASRNYAGAAFRLVKSTGKGILIATAVNATLLGFCVSEQYFKHPIKYFGKPKPLIADTFKSLGARFERFGDIINPPEKIAESVIPVPQTPIVVTRQVFVNFDSLQERKITELGAIEYSADSVYKFTVKDQRKGIGAAFNNFIASKEFMMKIPVEARVGFNLTNIVKDKNFVVIDNELKQVTVKVPPVEILSVETRFELITEQDITENNGIFAKTEVMDVVKSFSNNQQKLKENLLDKEGYKQRALEDSKESLKGVLSLLTGNSSKYKGYTIVFDDLTEVEARKMGWKSQLELEKEQSKALNTQK